MQEVRTMLDLIDAYLEQLQLIKAQPTIDDVLVDKVLWKILGLAIEANDLYDEVYREELDKLEKIETTTLRGELLKREGILKLSQTRESLLENIFDKTDEEQKKLYDLFEDIRNEQKYETVFYDSDVQLVSEQISIVTKNKKKEQLLNEELRNNVKRIEFLKNEIKSFEDLNAEMNEIYKNFIEINEMDDIDIDINEIAVNKIVEMERLSIIEENEKLLKTAVNIDKNQLKHIGEKYERSKNLLEEYNKLLFMNDLTNLMKKEVKNYDELLHKVESIGALVEEREMDLVSSFPNEQHSVESYRTMFFLNDIKKVQDHMFNYSNEILKLEERNKEIENELETLYDNVKGRKELEEIITGKSKEGFLDKDKITTFEAEEPSYEGETPKLEKEQEYIEDETLKLEKEQEYTEDEVYKVKEIEKAKPTLLEKLRKSKNKFLLFCKKAAIIIAAGTILLSSGAIVKDKDEIINKVEAIEQAPTTSVEELITKLESAEKEMEYTEEYITHSIGDKIKLNNGAHYYRDALSAQLNEEAFIVGKNSLRPEAYNINRMAIMEKDEMGRSTGKILAINTTPGVSSKELAESLGLTEDQYEVMIHISKGDANGDFIEADINRPSPDDLCWLRGDDMNFSLVSPAHEVLKQNERGMAK